MRPKFAVSALALAAALACTPGAASAAVVLQTNSAESCGPSGCAFNAAGSYYQTFGAGLFSGPQTISSLRLNRSLLGAFASKMFQVTFRTGDNAAQVGDFGLFTITGLAGDEVLLTSANGFTWDPAYGDLMLRISVWGMGDAHLPESYAPLTFSQVLAPPPQGGKDGGTGASAPVGEDPLADDPPVEDLPGPTGTPDVEPPSVVDPLALPGNDQLPASPTPEPGTWALLIGGFGLSGALLRRRRREILA